MSTSDRLAVVLLITGPFAGPAATQAPHDECNSALALALGLTPGTNAGSTTSAGSTEICTEFTSDVWYSYLAGAPGLLTISTAAGGGSASFDTTLAAYGGSCGALVLLACNDNNLNYPYTLQSEVVVPVQPGQRLFVRLGGLAGATGSFVLAATLADIAPVANDTCTAALPLLPGLTAGSTVGATTSPEPASCVVMQNDVWFSHDAVEDGLLTVSTAYFGGSASFDTALAAYQGSCGQLVQVACHDNISLDWWMSYITVPVTAGERSFVRLGGKFGQSGDYELAATFVAGQVPANDGCESAQLVTGGLVHGNTELATWSGVKSYCLTPLFKDVWFRYVAPVEGVLSAELLGDPYPSGMLCLTDSCTSQYLPNCDEFCYRGPASDQKDWLDAGESVLLVVSGVNAVNGGDFTLSMDFEPTVPDVYVNPLNGHMYILTPTNMTWHGASAWAQGVQGHLVTLADDLESVLLENHFDWPSRLWIGLTDEAAEGAFAWVTGEPLAYTAWQHGQPDDNCFGATEDYAAMLLANGEWSDYTDNRCFNPPFRGLVEIDGPAAFAVAQVVGEGCPADSPPLLGGGLPMLGQVLSLFVVDPVPATGALFASAVPAAPQPFGSCVIQLDLATHFFVAPIATSSDGIDTLDVQVPGDPVLAGLAFALQAALLHADTPDLSLSNGLHLQLGY